LLAEQMLIQRTPVKYQCTCHVPEQAKHMLISPAGCCKSDSKTRRIFCQWGGNLIQQKRWLPLKYVGTCENGAAALRLINPAIFLFKTKRPGVGHSK
jgi:hypothetical protein